MKFQFQCPLNEVLVENSHTHVWVYQQLLHCTLALSHCNVVHKAICCLVQKRQEKTGQPLNWRVAQVLAEREEKREEGQHSL